MIAIPQRVAGTLPGRLPPDAMFPTGRPGFRVATISTATGERVRVVESGPPDGAPVVLVHGWGCSAYSFHRIMPALAAAGWRAIAPDLRGHGLSDMPPEESRYSVGAMTAHLLDTMGALRVEDAALIAHSLGAQFAIEAVLQAPARVTELALLSPVGAGLVKLAVLGRLLTPHVVTPLLPRLAQPWVIRAALGAAYGRLGGPTRSDVQEYWAPSQFPAFAPAMRHLLHAPLWSTRPASDLARVRVPTLVVFGTRDHLVPTHAVGDYVGAMPSARLELIEGAGHVLPHEAPDEINALLLGFLGSRGADREFKS